MIGRPEEAPAAEFFRDARSAALGIRRLDVVIDSGEAAPRASGKGGSRPLVSDPTASSALSNVSAVESAQRERDALIELVGEALEVVQGVRDAIGKKYGDTLDERYLTDREPWTWDDVAREMQAPKRTVQLWHSVALDYVDSVGIDGAKESRKP